MLSCREVSALASETLDREMRFRERFGMLLHLMLCRICRRYVKQIRFLSTASRVLKDKVLEDTQPRLNDAARQRIKKRLTEEP